MSDDLKCTERRRGQKCVTNPLKMSEMPSTNFFTKVGRDGAVLELFLFFVQHSEEKRKIHRILSYDRELQSK
jgi:hypothetical protein